MKSRHLTADHYLRIYRIRLANAADGTTAPKPEFVDFMRTFVTSLEMVDPNTAVRLETLPGKARFTDAATGTLFAEIGLGDV